MNKTQLISITEEMAGKELVDALNENFKRLNDDSFNRHQYVTSKLNDIEGDIKAMRKDIRTILTKFEGKQLLNDGDTKG